MQSTLISKGYNCGSYGADGTFGQGTCDAVVRLQNDHGLSADGIVGPDVWNALGNGGSSSALLRTGSKGDSVRRLQSTLISKGYNCGSYGADGTFGQGTCDAVVRLQNDHGLSADGIVGPDVWNALGNGDSGSSSALLRSGSKGDSVRKLQSALISKGYNCGSYGADGTFGQGTYNAVVKLQNDHGLSADGIAGPDVWNALGNGGSGSSSALLRSGSKGDSVRKLQSALISKGYNCGSYGADGTFGQGTYNAVVKLQNDHGLSADGIAGPDVWNALGNGGSDSSSGSCFVPGAPGINKFIAVAKQELSKGFSEHIISSNGEGDNMTPYGAWYGMNGEPWCAMFVSWCANQAGILGNVVPMYAYCPYGKNWYADKGRYRFPIMGYTPKEGDVVFYRSNGVSCHTGIVIGCNPSTHMITTIEGNEGQAVRKKERSYLNNSYVDGFGDNGGPTATIKPAPTMDIFELYRRESKCGFANLFGINISNKAEQNIINTPSIKIDFSASVTYAIGTGALKCSVENGKVSGFVKSSVTDKIYSTLSPNKTATLSYQLAKLGDGDLNLICSGTLGSTPNFSGTLSFHNKIEGRDFYQNLKFTLTKNFFDGLEKAVLEEATKAVAVSAVVAAIVAIIIMAPPAVVILPYLTDLLQEFIAILARNAIPLQ